MAYLFVFTIMIIHNYIDNFSHVPVKDSDRISLVVYDSCVNLMFELMSMTEENKERARSLITSIITGSSTNLCGGLLKGE